MYCKIHSFNCLLVIVHSIAESHNAFFVLFVMKTEVEFEVDEIQKYERMDGRIIRLRSRR